MGPNKSLLDFFDDLSHPDPGSNWFAGNELQSLHTDDPATRALLEQTLEERRSFIRKFDWGTSTQWEERREAFVKGLLTFEERFEQLLSHDIRRNVHPGKRSTAAHPGKEKPGPEKDA